MKIIFVNLSVVFVMVTKACLATSLEAEICANTERLTGLPIKTFNYCSIAPPEKAWRAYRNIYYSGYGHQNPEVVQRASVAIANNTTIGVYIEDVLEKIPHSALNFPRRFSYFETLGSIPAAWSARILGKYLLDETPLIGEPPDDYDSAPNSSAAAIGFSMMNFPDGPTKGKLVPIGKEGMEEWKKWWKANESRIEDRIRQINPDYRPQFGANVGSAVPTPRPVAAPSLIPQLASESTKPLAKDHRSYVYLFIAGGFLVIVALGLTVAGWRKRLKAPRT